MVSLPKYLLVCLSESETEMSESNEVNAFANTAIIAIVISSAMAGTTVYQLSEGHSVVAGVLAVITAYLSLTTIYLMTCVVREQLKVFIVNQKTTKVS